MIHAFVRSYRRVFGTTIDHENDDATVMICQKSQNDNKEQLFKEPGACFTKLLMKI